MKKITMLMVAALIAFGGMSSAAQNNTQNDNKSRTECQGKDCKEHRGGKKGHKAGKHGDGCKLMEGITLTDAQKQKVEKLQGERRAEMEKNRQGNRDQVKKLNEKYDAELRGLLTADQVKTFDANKAKMADRRNGKKNCDGNGAQCKKNGKGHHGSKDAKACAKDGKCKGDCKNKAKGECKDQNCAKAAKK